MPYTIEKNEKENKAVITLTIPKEEVEQGMKQAAQQLAQNTKIPGFRPGKASYEVVKKRVGEAKLLDAAAEELIRGAFVKAMVKENLETVGQPHFDAEKMAPGNELIVKAEIALYPSVTKIADYNKLSVKRKNVNPKPETVERAKKDLAMMQTKETRAKKGHELEKGDKAVVNMTMKKDGVVLEGGESQDHAIYTAESHYINGFVDEILGMKEGDERKFTLPFPKDHYQKHLAEKDVDFTVTVNEIFRLETPKMDDAFAKSLGLKDKSDLESKLKTNLTMENSMEEERRLDKAVLDLIAEQSGFEAIPDLLVNQEIEKMLHEIKHSVNKQGMEFEAYLKQIGKTLPELKLDFTPTALTRVKVAILLGEIAKKEQIEITDEAVDKELDKIASQYKDEEAKKRVYEPVYRDYVRRQMKNRETIDFLKGIMVKDAK